MSNDKYWEKYLERVKKTRRHYFFQKMHLLDGLNIQSLSKVLGWIKADLVYATKWGLNILLQIRAYGNLIQREYGTSYAQQWLRLMYLTFLVPSIPKHYRTRLLFKQRNWEMADDFVLFHGRVQYDFVNRTSADEIEILRNKFKFCQYCDELNIPCADVVAVYKQGEQIYQNFDEYPVPATDLFAKDLYGAAGNGAKKFTYRDGFYSDSSGKQYSSDQVIQLIKTGSEKNSGVLVQKALENHSSWKKFTSGGLITCRIVTAINPEDEHSIIPMFSAVRMPLGNSDTDNYSKGGLIIPIDQQTGIMGSGVTLKPYTGKFELSKHPNTMQQIEGERLPHWKEILEFTLDLHSNFQTIFIGWDISFTTEGCCVVEGNIGWASCSYEIPFQDSLKNTIYPELFEKWMDKIGAV